MFGVEHAHGSDLPSWRARITVIGVGFNMKEWQCTLTPDFLRLQTRPHLHRYRNCNQQSQRATARSLQG
jgi:hypothetical protein